MKGIVLAGGEGARLKPLTLAVNKQLLPVYDKPMIYYPISVLMLAGIREILIISSPDYIESYKRLFGDGTSLGLKIEYATQPRTEGVAQACLIGESFIKDQNLALVLGDNFFFGPGMSEMLSRASAWKTGATIVCDRVIDPRAYGVVELDPSGRPVDIQEKPENPRSNCAVTGLYFYDNRVVEFCRTLKPSGRGELEITDLNRKYLQLHELHVEMLSCADTWLDIGTEDRLLDASAFVRTIQKAQGIRIACLEEISFKKGFIDREQLQSRAELFGQSEYGRYLIEIIGRH